MRLLRNHERSDPPATSVPTDVDRAYDSTANGGVTSLVLAADNRTVLSEHVSLSGTLQNCSGGMTPWGTWLSCEESHEGVATGRDREHGYVFEVAAAADAAVDPQPLTALGRFLHEAVAVDADGTVYLTEDNGYDSGLYRFTPSVNGTLDAGSLEMLAIIGRPGHDPAYAQPAGVQLPVSWVPIADPDPATSGVDSSAVFNQGFNGGGARFKRLEGCCIRDDTLFVSATEGGDAGLGQVWAYDIARAILWLCYEARAPDDLFGPDSLAVGSWSDRIVVAEDNGNGDPTAPSALDGWTARDVR